MAVFKNQQNRNKKYNTISKIKAVRIFKTIKENRNS